MTPYVVSLALFAAAVLTIVLVPKPARRKRRQAQSWETLSAGFRYIWREKIVLGAISLDMFAVLLGGAVALMPVFARDILHLGPWGLGMLRAGPGIGAIAMAMVLTARPIRRRAGHAMLVAVAVFGAGTIAFGLSRAAWLSVAALVVMGAADMISVYVRQTLIQLWTPDELRGRVSAVNQVFVGASNELGEFRAGGMAALIGTRSRRRRRRPGHARRRRSVGRPVPEAAPDRGARPAAVGRIAGPDAKPPPAATGHRLRCGISLPPSPPDCPPRTRSATRSRISTRSRPETPSSSAIRQTVLSSSSSRTPSA